jgi:hypothetical protein
MPFWTQAPNGEFDSHMHARAWVPLDDNHCMFVFIWWKKAKAANSMPPPKFKDGRVIGGTGRGFRLLPNGTGWLERWRMADNAANDWGLDRAAQMSGEIYSGIEGIHLQDQAICESMGPITDFAFEHLAPSDQMITRTRRRLLLAARGLRDRGELPPPERETTPSTGGLVAATSSAPTRVPGSKSTPIGWRALSTRRSPSKPDSPRVSIAHLRCALARGNTYFVQRVSA